MLKWPKQLESKKESTIYLLTDKITHYMHMYGIQTSQVYKLLELKKCKIVHNYFYYFIY